MRLFFSRVAMSASVFNVLTGDVVIFTIVIVIVVVVVVIIVDITQNTTRREPVPSVQIKNRESWTGLHILTPQFLFFVKVFFIMKPTLINL